jgi:hypothetical protein
MAEGSLPRWSRRPSLVSASRGDPRIGVSDGVNERTRMMSQLPRCLLAVDHGMKAQRVQGFGRVEQRILLSPAERCEQRRQEPGRTTAISSILERARP